MSHPFDPLPPNDDWETFVPSWPPLEIRDGGFEDNEDRAPIAAAIAVVVFILFILCVLSGVLRWLP